MPDSSTWHYGANDVDLSALKRYETGAFMPTSAMVRNLHNSKMGEFLHQFANRSEVQSWENEL